MNFQGKQNLLKFKNSCVVTVQGKTESKVGVFIPIEDNHLFISTDDNKKAKGAYFDFMAWENSNSQYGETHSIRQSLSKDIRSSMTDDQLKEIPFIGNMKPFEKTNEASTVASTNAEVEDKDDLPF